MTSLSAVAPESVFPRDGMRRLVRAGLVTGVIDGLFSSLLNVFAYGSTVTRLFQGVAATLLGREALDGGSSTAAVGVLMHFGVAFGWSAVFMFLVMRSSWVRGLLTSRYGAIKVASLYGPFVWIVMSLAVIPFLVGRPPAINRPLVDPVVRTHSVRRHTDRDVDRRPCSACASGVLRQLGLKFRRSLVRQGKASEPKVGRVRPPRTTVRVTEAYDHR